MKASRNFLAIAVVLLLTSFNPTRAQKVTMAADASAPLRDRWTAMAGKAKQEQGSERYWIGYSIDRKMGKRSFIGSWSSDESRNRPSLTEILTGRKADPIMTGHHDFEGSMSGNFDFQDAPDAEQTVTKEVAVLFEFSDGGKIDDLKMSNTELHVDLEGYHLYWIGSASQVESEAFLESMSGAVASSHAMKPLLMAIAMHGEAPHGMEFMKGILMGSEPAKVREEAAFWIGQTDRPEAVGILLKSAQDDKSESVMEKSIFSISQISGEAATDALISLARTHTNGEMKKKAIFWLSQKASKKSVAALKDFVYNEKETEIQKQALFALTQVNETGAVDELITVAKTHPNPKIRKEAIFWLGQSEDPRALEAIVEIAKK